MFSKLFSNVNFENNFILIYPLFSVNHISKCHEEYTVQLSCNKWFFEPGLVGVKIPSGEQVLVLCSALKWRAAIVPKEERRQHNLLGCDYWALSRSPEPTIVGFRDLVGVGICPFSKKMAGKRQEIENTHVGYLQTFLFLFCTIIILFFIHFGFDIGFNFSFFLFTFQKF